ncbi:glycoside hydrolase family 65 [bacterium]|nr:MAG: glycoside hydrolase family 65 [bacterium]
MNQAINRAEVVRRHNPEVNAINPFAALSIGNGEFAFTADVTGLQTFIERYEHDFPLCTVSHWGWHSLPLPAGSQVSDFQYENFDSYGRPVPYPTSKKGQEPLFNWLRENPHRLHLGRVGLEMTKADGTPVGANDLSNIRQSLDLWTGILNSHFEIEGEPVTVVTSCHPKVDLLSVRVDSPLIAKERLKVVIAFPYGSSRISMAEWGQADRHQTLLKHGAKNRVEFERHVDETRYVTNLAWSGQAAVTQRKAHEFVLAGQGKRMEFRVLYAPQQFEDGLPSVKQTEKASGEHWKQFWNQGGAIDFGGSSAPQAHELERRVVLSQYQTALHCAGSLPSQETGLLFNSWYGKFHLEMHWWHSVHFAQWGRFALFQKSMAIYQRLLPQARATALQQGYKGARWPKMIGPDGRDSPSPVGPLLIWQQPHPIYYAELCYRQEPSQKTLAQWRDIVFASAEFMVSYAVFDAARGHYVLGPPLKTVSENTPINTAINPTFELAYWRFGLRIAQEWRERLGLGRDAEWDKVLHQLAPLPQSDGLYLLQEGMTDTYSKWNWEHPALVGAYGVQPGDGVDAEVMRRTVSKVVKDWQWERTWGWDFPMAAMAAARTGQPELAVEMLLHPAARNRYHPNGHNYQREDLTAYLPGNGGLLAAVAMMAAGWSGAPTHHAPGFPSDGSWKVRFEGLKPLL